MRTLPFLVLPFVALVVALPAQTPPAPAPPPAPPAPAPPVPPAKVGYEGPLPSEAAQQALREIEGKPWHDSANRFGGGTWQVDPGGVTPHALGPCRGDMGELREMVVKGPNLRFVRDHLCVCFPTATDGDVAATLRWLGREVPAGIAGEPTAAWRRAVQRLESLGAEAAGLRAGLLADPGQSGRVTLLVWKTGTDTEPITGKAVLKVDGEPVPIELAWRAKEAPGKGRMDLRPVPGTTFDLALDVDALRQASGKPKLQEGVRLLQVVMTYRTSRGKEIEISTQRLQYQVAGPNGVK